MHINSIFAPLVTETSDWDRMNPVNTYGDLNDAVVPFSVPYDYSNKELTQALQDIYKDNFIKIPRKELSKEMVFSNDNGNEYIVKRDSKWYYIHTDGTPYPQYGFRILNPRIFE